MNHICIINYGLKVYVALKYCLCLDLSLYSYTKLDLKGKKRSYKGISHDCHILPSILRVRIIIKAITPYNL